MLRLGEIEYLNTLPFSAVFLDLELKEDAHSISGTRCGMSVIKDTPAGLNAKLLAGELDASGVSAACLLQNPQALIQLPGLGISSPGPVMSVTVLSPVPWAALAEQPAIQVTPASASARAMLKGLLLEQFGQYPVFEELRDAHREGARGRERPSKKSHVRLETIPPLQPKLIIGDAALAELDNPNWPYKLDLASQWHAHTGLPAVFGVWAARRAWAEQHPEAFIALSEALQAAANCYKTEAHRQAQVLELAYNRSDLPRARLETYLTCAIDYAWQDAHAQALARLGEMLKLERTTLPA
ncbi:MAG: menaquinone biosynthesis protein [Vampirovibrionales bacterium]|nr:menaquinone biosynthesis protein [Vampirovibrionales bacterium]